MRKIDWKCYIIFIVDINSPGNMFSFKKKIHTRNEEPDLFGDA